MRLALLLGIVLIAGCGSPAPAPDDPCQPTTCAARGADCGAIGDGCGGVLECGACAAPQSCGGGGVANVCAEADCQPEADESLCLRHGRACGTFTGTERCGSDREARCGACAAPESCGGGGVEGQCGCAPETLAELCAAAGFDCGSVERADRCGDRRLLDCGQCTAPATCGGSGVENVCGSPGCSETDTAFCRRLGRSCGPSTGRDLCGIDRTVDCGRCTAPQTCGGGGLPGVCGTPGDVDPKVFCAFVGANCGDVTAPDSAGVVRTKYCGACTAPMGCGAGGTPNQCGCTPTTCAALGRSCGKVPDDCGGELDCGPCPGGEAPAPYCLRIMAANTTSGDAQSYELGHGIRIFQGLQPDVVLIQEFNYGASVDSDLRVMIDQAFGTNFWHLREPDDDELANGVISRFPIIDSGEWDDTGVSNRDFAWARIDVPGPRDLWAVSVHLLTKGPTYRDSEAKELVGYIRQKVPAGDFLVIGGDLNTVDYQEPCLTSLAQVVDTAPPHPADQSGRTGTNASRRAPLDWVMVNPALGPHQSPVRIGTNSFPSGLVFDSRVYSPLSDVSPVLATDSGAPYMQHMAVIKDFCLPL